MSEFTVRGHTYKTRRLPAMEQFHVMRRLAPIINHLGDLSSLQSATGLDALGPVAQAIANLPDDHCNFIFATCLGACDRRQEGGSWAPVWSKGAKGPMFEDVDLLAMLEITMRVIQEALGDFFPDLPLGSSGRDPL